MMTRSVNIAVRCALSLLPLLAGGQPRPKIVVSNMSGERLAALRAAAPRADFVVVRTPGELHAAIRDADGLIGNPTQELLRSAPKLRWIQVGSAGVDEILFPELANSNIVLTNGKILMGPEIADHALALLLSLTRRLNELIPLYASRDWPQEQYRAAHRPIELNGRTALVIGLGGIGMQIAQRAWAFGMRVMAIDPRDMPMSAFVTKVYPPDRLRDVLPQADVVFMSAPATPETARMLGPAEFGAMKPGSYFVAVSRGTTYDGSALAKALDEKRLAGAGLDVTDPEPLPKNSPLWNLPNVVITPHIAGQSDKYQERQLEVIKENARRFTEGLPLINVVDKKKGY